ncbi:MAG: hypothetical protein ACTHJ9_17305 [Rhodanobacter sp.]
MSAFVDAAATVIKATSTGLSKSGALSIPGLQVGDLLVKVIPASFAFEQVVSVQDQLQQQDSLDWSSVNFTFYLLRGV